MSNEHSRHTQESANTVQLGDVCEATIVKFAESGIVCRVGNHLGLIPPREISWRNDSRDSYMLRVDMDIQVKVIRIRQDGRLLLSRRKAMETPWETAILLPGDIMNGVVYEEGRNGWFVEFPDGLYGVIYKMNLPVQLHIGEHIQTEVREFNPEMRMLRLNYLGDAGVGHCDY